MSSSTWLLLELVPLGDSNQQALFVTQRDDVVVEARNLDATALVLHLGEGLRKRHRWIHDRAAK